MAHKGILVFFALILLMSAPAGWGAGSFKCGTRIVQTGDTTLDVLNTCGEPTFREYVGTESGGSFAEGRRESDDRTGGEVARGRYGEFSVNVERWYYDCGRNKFVRILLFKGGILRSIKLGRDYGVGASDCIGPVSGGSQSDPQRDFAEPHGAVSILGTPYGAKIYLDQEYMADLPATVEKIEPGAYTLTVKSPGYRDSMKRIVVESEKTVYVNVYLQRNKKQTEEGIPDQEKTSSNPPARIYKWTDEEGNIHITDKPPPMVD
jgi:hypothetical protein